MITKTRHSFDNALRALPVTQHGRIWDLYLQFAKAAGGETAMRINRRYLKVKKKKLSGFCSRLTLFFSLNLPMSKTTLKA